MNVHINQQTEHHRAKESKRKNEIEKKLNETKKIKIIQKRRREYKLNGKKVRKYCKKKSGKKRNDK